jgi:hypothetical protein
MSNIVVLHDLCPNESNVLTLGLTSLDHFFWIYFYFEAWDVALNPLPPKNWGE